MKQDTYMSGFSAIPVDRLKAVTMTRTDTIYRKLSELAVGSALNHEGYGRLPQHLIGGIVGISDYGDRYPELYVEREGRIRPMEFGASVLNSAVGHCSIVFNLRGPQFHLPLLGHSFSYALKLAKQQIAAKRAQLMVVVLFDDERLQATATVLSSWEIVEGVRRRT